MLNAMRELRDDDGGDDDRDTCDDCELLKDN